MIFANRKQTLALTLAPGIALALGTDYPRSLSVTKPSPSLYLSLYLVIISNQTLALALSRYNSLKNILSCYYIACDGAAANLHPTLVLALASRYLFIALADNPQTNPCPWGYTTPVSFNLPVMN